MYRPKRYRILCSLFLSWIVANHVQSQISVYPNPFIDKTAVTFTISQADTVTIFVMNMLGKTIATLLPATPLPPGVFKDTLDLTGQPAGVYHMTLKGSKNTDIIRLIKSTEVSVREQQPSTAPFVFPNPSKSGQPIHLHLPFPLPSSLRITLISPMGEILTEGHEFERIPATICELPSGTYWLLVSSVEGSRLVPFIRN